MIPNFRAWLVPDMYEEPVIHNGKFYLDWLDFENGNTYDLAVLMQSTGMFDKNGVEIFDGDIVKLRYTITSDFELFKVNQFRGGSWRIDNRRRGTELWLRNEDCVVIGNIYQNSELLERLEG
ncbi:YopX family protein [Streptococcus agalactiae]|uniref:YopX family protein n=1 Tax=Streptococcus agalactiae TaxID=1311 RepID=UPI0039C66B14